MPIDIGTITDAFEQAVATTNSSMLSVLVVLVILMVLSFTGVSWLFFRSQGGKDKSNGSAIMALAETLSDTSKAQREAAASQQMLAVAQATLVEQLGAMVTAVRENTEADVRRMGELRDGIKRMADSGEQQVSMLAELRSDFQGVSGLGAKIDAIQKTIESMKANVETLMSETGNPSVSSILGRIEAQFNLLAREMSETRHDINAALELIAQGTAARESAPDGAENHDAH
jgi:archaellum component FlaC